MNKKRIPALPQPVEDFLPFKKGLDQVTPSWNTTPGTCREMQNLEVGINGGFDTLAGYERFDGQDAPSAGQYAVFTVTSGHTMAVGETVTGDTSSATSVCIAVTDTTIVVTKISGDYEANGEDLSGSSGGAATASTDSIINGASTTLLHAQYNNLAADEYRSDIAAVTGSGDILGVKMLDDVVYAFRNNAGGTAAALYKSTSSGWSAVALGRELSFTSGGTTEIVEGNTITGATSSATAVITRVALESGSWGAGTAAGRFIFASQTGTFQSENINVGASTNLATIAGDSSAITLLPDGRYEMILHNFGGQSGTKRIYGCDGVNRGFEFDGSVFVPISTGMTADTPSHVAAHKGHLFFAFAGSAQHSGTGTPYIFSPVFGASEIAVGDDITAFHKEPGSESGGALGIYSRNSIYLLYGSSTSDWNLVPYREEIGAYAYTVQNVGVTMFLDDRGVTELRTSQAFGNFKHSTLSRLIQPFINSKRKISTDSCIVRDKDQYRLFFSDNSALYVTMEGNKVLGMAPVLLSHKVTCITSQEAGDGSEVIYFGSDDGYVYQMEKGTSFDGGDIEFFGILHYHHSKSPQWIKSYKGAVLEVAGEGYGAFSFSYELGYTSTDIAQPGSVTKTLSFSSSRWDSFTWDAFYWDGQVLTPSDCEVEGDAENISLIIRGGADYYSPMSFTGALLRYIVRKPKR